MNRNLTEQTWGRRFQSLQDSTQVSLTLAPIRFVRKWPERFWTAEEVGFNKQRDGVHSFPLIFLLNELELNRQSSKI